MHGRFSIIGGMCPGCPTKSTPMHGRGPRQLEVPRVTDVGPPLVTFIVVLID